MDEGYGIKSPKKPDHGIIYYHILSYILHQGGTGNANTLRTRVFFTVSFSLFLQQLTARGRAFARPPAGWRLLPAAAASELPAYARDCDRRVAQVRCAGGCVPGHPAVLQHVVRRQLVLLMRRGQQQARHPAAAPRAPARASLRSRSLESSADRISRRRRLCARSDPIRSDSDLAQRRGWQTLLLFGE